MSADCSFRTLSFALIVFVTACLTGPTLLHAQKQPPKPDRGFLGVTSKNVPNGQGVEVTYIYPTSAAETLGFALGDHVFLVNDVRVKNQQDFSNELRGENAGATMRFVVKRDGKTVRIKGKLGGYQKTMAQFEQRVRKEMLGKPLPKIPGLRWWNVETVGWYEKDTGINSLKGRVVLLFAYDNCPTCESQRFAPLTEWAGLLRKDAQSDDDVALVGLYFAQGNSSKVGQQSASILYEATEPKFHATFARYPKDYKADWAKQAFLQHHGMTLIDDEGIVRYVQILGRPGTEISQAFAAALT